MKRKPCFKKNTGFILIFLIFILFSCSSENCIQEISLTHDLSKNFDLDGRHNFSPGDRWLVYDTRTEESGIGGCQTIEKVNVASGEIVVLYHTKNATPFGPGVGAPSYSHTENRTVFIHGLQNCNADKPYAQWRRTGVIIDDKHIGQPVFMDARDVTPPFTPGALRGGTHQHEWSGDGQWIGFTYNDAIMKKLQDRTGVHWNLRTIGVSRAIRPVQVDHDPEGENVDGTHFSVIVVKVVANPVPGSDEISRAANDSWVGSRGYRTADGSWQRGRAFIGTVKNEQGEDVDEVFIVDIPERIDIPGPDGPLAGTEISFPMPPAGTVQRRLTFTAGTNYPGCLGFTRCSPDGKWISYRAKDDNGIVQVFFISPLSGKPVQVTRHNSEVQSAVRWQANGELIYYVWDNSIIRCDVRPGGTFGRFNRLNRKRLQPPANIILSHDGKTLAFNRTVTGKDGNGKSKQIFLLHLD
ncbi:MAG TPA: DUF3748 domain-containing protein [Bacteroidetes bacterium]|nr:DUF3748 domain-containing protein [Bacteroidota bacterium]